MKTLPKYARKHHDNFLDYLTSLSGVRKKDLTKKIENSSITDLMRYLLYSKSLIRNSDNITIIQALENEIGTLACYNTGNHFCVRKLPTLTPMSVSVTDFLEKDLYVDFSYAGKDCFIHAWKRNWPCVIDGVPYVYNVSLFVDDAAMREENATELGKKYSKLCEFLQTYKLSVTTDFKTWIMEVPYSNKYVLHRTVCDVKQSAKDEFVFTPQEPDVICKEVGIPNPSELINLINYVAYCYTNKESLSDRTNPSARKYSRCKVHSVSVTKKDSDDVYVTLGSKPKAERKPYVNKGGHHASPVAHDRKGFYRKSRGRGDYDLVGDQYVYVGDKKGKYSKVAPTHVDGTKTKKTKVYKI